MSEKLEVDSLSNEVQREGQISDPAAIHIDPVLEKRIITKFDWLVLPQFVIIIILGFVLFFPLGAYICMRWTVVPMLTNPVISSYLDRSNIGNARIFGFEDDLGLEGNEFANLSSFFYVTYVIFEIPWVLALKAWGANAIMAIAIVLWSAVTIGTGFVQNYQQAVGCRLALGFAEAGIFPALTFVVSTIYPRESQGKRVAVLYGATALSGACGGLIAYGIQQMGTKLGLEAWRWLFIIEGAFSFAFGILCWASLPKASDEAWFLKPEERQLMKNRRIRDAAYTGTHEKFSWAHLKLAFTDVMVWVAAVTLFCGGIPLFGFGIFLPTIIRGFG